MKILVTGGNGFLGYNIIDQLLNNGHEILVLSRNFNRFTTTVNKKLKFSRIITDTYTSHTEAILEFSPDVAIHCAWAGGNSYNDVNHLNQYNHNIPASISLLEILSKLQNSSKFIGFGSFTEYGTLKTKAREEQTEQPITHYGVAKNTLKNISKLFCEQHNIAWSWIRPCYIYGEGDVETRLLPTVISKLKKGEHITLDSCDTTIDYLHVSDFSKAVQSIVSCEEDGIFNVCSGEEYNLKDIIKYIAKKLHKENQITFSNTEDRKYSSKYICGDNNKLIISSNWEPTISIYEGINNLLKYDTR